MGGQGPDGTLSDAPEVSLEQRKAEFLEATRQIDLLAPLRKHPYLTVGTALAMGISAGAPRLAAKAKEAKGSLTGRLIKSVGLRLLQRFIQSRVAKAHAAAVAQSTPQAAQASA